MIDTNRLKTHVLFSGAENGTPVLFLHGNASSATYWEELMLKLPVGFRGIAPDLRGYGDTEDKLIDATRGAGDWVGESSEAIRARVQAARDIQTKRYSSIRNSSNDLSTIVCNADMRVGKSASIASCRRKGRA